jgi:signal transduction histidine kinase
MARTEAMPEDGELKVDGEIKGDHAILSVRDMGADIPYDEKNNIFTPFRPRKQKGMGLGLAYCRRAVEAHGGSIGFESKAWEGTTFTVTLPVKSSS